MSLLCFSPCCIFLTCLVAENDNHHEENGVDDHRDDDKDDDENDDGYHQGKEK